MQKLEPIWRTKMKLSGNQFNFTYTGARLIAAATLLATLAFTPGVVFAADKDAHQDRTELRIKDMHTKLKITTAQEPQWGKVAQAMRDDAKTMDSLTSARMAHAKDMTAVDDLKSYGEIVDAHADGIKKLTPAFADLYASMSDTQKKTADDLFRHGAQAHKTPKGK
jgi:cell pole-organizing protein PopZ